MNMQLFGAAASSQLAQRISVAWPWYITRASGMVAALLLILLILTGVGTLTGYEFKFLSPIRAWANHRRLGIAFAVMVGIHGASLLLDHYITFNIFQVFIPFTSHYRSTKLFGVSVGSLGVALGITAMYAIAVVLYTSWKWIGTRAILWKRLHLLSYLILVLVLFHSLMVGSDVRYGLFRLAWIMLNVLVGIVIVVRIRRVGSLE